MAKNKREMELSGIFFVVVVVLLQILKIRTYPTFLGHTEE